MFNKKNQSNSVKINQTVLRVIGWNRKLDAGSRQLTLEDVLNYSSSTKEKFGLEVEIAVISFNCVFIL